jgi:hypothetical protein
MSKQIKPKVKREKPLVFPKRLSVRLDDDVIDLANASAQTVDWASLSHAVNAAFRRAFAPFKPPGLRLCVNPFDQLVFARRITIKKRTK